MKFQSLAAHISLVLSLISLPLGASAALYQNANDLPDVSYDFVIVGGGVGGSVLANRLTENPSTKVLVLEGGPSNEDAFETKVPFFVTRIPSQYTWNYTTTPQVAVPSMECFTLVVLLTTSTAMLKSPATLVGPGITSKHILHETRNGHLQPTVTTPQANTILPSIAPLASTPTVSPVTSKHSIPWCSKRDKNSGAAINGSHRSSAATSYLGPQFISRPNLHVLVNARVSRILQTGSGSTFQGVEYTQDINSGPLRTVTATKEVLLAAGVIGTPQIFLNSGIGDSSYLTSVGIPPLVNLPSVGRNLTDQPTTGCLWNVRSDADTFDPVFQEQNVLDDAMDEWNADGTG
ncbi:GMC oxidoreductase family protein, partial [Pleurotus pulmonarius]